MMNNLKELYEKLENAYELIFEKHKEELDNEPNEYMEEYERNKRELMKEHAIKYGVKDFLDE